ncbi:MAG TPA: N-acetyltransferase [Oceanospirillaceae bacterium]|nr:N-acetyltransferase [Oceanospirillaceae bacterium]
MQLHLHPNTLELGQTHWQQYLDQASDPFNQYAFHAALEQSGSVGGKSGWQTMHLEITHQGDPVALIPSYIKTHSWGEYVFDFEWANAYQRYGLEYYPKLISAVPFTPCAGPRILLAPNANLDHALSFLQEQLPHLCAQLKLSSWHWLFAQQPDWQAAQQQTWHQRMGCQYHWYNKNYHEFADFTARLTSRKRKSINKERRVIAEQGIDFTWQRGSDIKPQALQKFYHCYQSTYLKRSRQGYLTYDFFAQLLIQMPDKLLLITASQGQNPLAYALFFVDDHTLYGRYWGCLEEVDYLHFETCYYQGIDYCIANNIPHFDAGAQGEHKLARGFIPQTTHSYHYLAETGFNDAIEQYCKAEAEQIDHYVLWAQTALPYKTKQ